MLHEQVSPSITYAHPLSTAPDLSSDGFYKVTSGSRSRSLVYSSFAGNGVEDRPQMCRSHQLVERHSRCRSMHYDTGEPFPYLLVVEENLKSDDSTMLLLDQRFYGACGSCVKSRFSPAKADLYM